jgi:hypothetical protein
MGKEVWMVAVFALAVSATGCKEEATCSTAMSNFYDHGCGLVIGGEAISEADATQGCYEEAADYEAAGCGEERTAGLECLTSASGCADCDYEVFELNACMGFY